MNQFSPKLSYRGIPKSVKKCSYLAYSRKRPKFNNKNAIKLSQSNSTFNSITSSNNIMIHLIVTLLPFLIHSALSLQPRHDYSSSYYYPFSTRTQASYMSRPSTTTSTVGGVIAFVIICIIAGIIVYYICKRCRRNQQVPAPYYPPPPQQNFAYPPVYEPSRFQQYPPANNGYPNPQSQSNYNYPSAPDYSNNLQDNWQGPDYSASRKLKQDCGFCKTYSKYGEEPRIMLSCPERHTFHLVCINQHRVAANRMGAYVNTCPVCSQNVDERVRFYCMLCKQKGIQIDFKQFSDGNGVIDITRLIGKYGQYCRSCKKM